METYDGNLKQDLDGLEAHLGHAPQNKPFTIDEPPPSTITQLTQHISNIFKKIKEAANPVKN